MTFGVNRRADAPVVVRLERIDDPSIQVHFIGGFLGAQATALAFSLQLGARRYRGLVHRVTPLRIFCACSEFGNSVCTRRAYMAAATASPSLRCERNPSHS